MTGRRLLDALCDASDLARGLPVGTATRAAQYADRIAALARLSPADRSTASAVARLRCVGFAATASTLAATLGDDLAAGAALGGIDGRDLASVLAAAGRLHLAGGPSGGGDAGSGGLDRAWFAGATRPMLRDRATTGAEVAALVARCFGFEPAVVSGLGAGFERWDGKGYPEIRNGSAIPVAVRVAQIADLFAVVGLHAGLDLLPGRAGGEFEPALVDGIRSVAGELVDLPAVPASGPMGDPTFIAMADRATDPPPGPAADPAFGPRPDPAGASAVHLATEDAFAALGALADLKSVWTRGHSGGAAHLAATAAADLGLDPVAIRRAALVRGLGRLAVPSTVWDFAGPLRGAALDAARSYPATSARLWPVELADPAGALLHAADVARSLGEDRPHRRALGAAERARLVRGGPWPSAVAEAVLAAPAAVPRSPLPPRQQRALEAAVRGADPDQLAGLLHTSPRRASKELAAAYDQLEVRTAGGAAFAAAIRGWLN